MIWPQYYWFGIFIIVGIQFVLKMDSVLTGVELIYGSLVIIIEFY